MTQCYRHALHMGAAGTCFKRPPRAATFCPLQPASRGRAIEPVGSVGNVSRIAKLLEQEPFAILYRPQQIIREDILGVIPL